MAAAAQSGAPMHAVLEAHHLLPPDTLIAAAARFHALPRFDPTLRPVDPALIDRFGPARCLSTGVLPWAVEGGVTHIALATPADATRLDPLLRGMFGHWTPALATEAEIALAVTAHRATALRLRAEARTAPDESCRTWRLGRLRGLALMATLALAATLATAPQVVVTALFLWAVATLLSIVTLRSAALIAALRPSPPSPTGPTNAPWPIVSLIVPLYREADIAPRLLARLGRIDYPRDLLDVILAVEECDTQTRNTLNQNTLPGWMRVVVVPDGPLRTKPRTLNYALDFCRGSVIGIYDAEDAPAPDQIARVVTRFAHGPRDVACLQGILDYYNPRTNWIARCFTLEYAAWFRVMMPGLSHLGIPLPLGGTTLFLRRAALEAVGAWDAHNVTEDADLGIRLARYGFRTEMIDTTTGEEANCRLRPWVRQRSRWIKGHMVTWAVHMRHPIALWRGLGTRGFLGYQVLFIGAQSQFLLAPLLWSLWLVPLGLSHPLAGWVGDGALTALSGFFLFTEALGIAVAVLGARRTRHPGLWGWAFTLPVYFPLATLAAWRALWEVFARPFYWAKTSHGHFG